MELWHWGEAGGEEMEGSQYLSRLLLIKNSPDSFYKSLEFTGHSEGQWTYWDRQLYSFLSVFLSIFSFNSQIKMVLLKAHGRLKHFKTWSMGFPRRTALIWTLQSIWIIKAHCTIQGALCTLSSLLRPPSASSVWSCRGIICLRRVAFLGEEMKNGEEIVITAEAKAENGGHLTGAYRTLKPAGLSPTGGPGFNTRKEIITPTLTLNLL